MLEFNFFYLMADSYIASFPFRQILHVSSENWLESSTQSDNIHSCIDDSTYALKLIVR